MLVCSVSTTQRKIATVGEHLVVDIETNDPGDFRTLEDLETIFCICVTDARIPNDFVDNYYDGSNLDTQRSGDIAEGQHRCLEAARLIGHNLVGFDVPVMEWMDGITFDQSRIADTQVLSFLAWPDLYAKDATVRRIPQHFWGSHSLAAWGHRLGCQKDEAYKTQDGAWDKLTPDMLRYCAQDVEVTRRLYQYFLKQPLSSRAVALEHAFADVLQHQMARGTAFDVERAAEVVSELEGRRLPLEEQLAEMVESFVDEYETPVRKEKKTRVTPFNPRSDRHKVRHFMERRGWKPTVKTPTGLPKLGADIIRAMPWPEAKVMAEHAEITKIMGYLADGKKAWTKMVKPSGRIHGSIRHNGTVTSRCTHSSPNLGNVPTTGELGHLCRSLFIASSGKVMVGCDASGLELRMLAHHLAEWDDGEFARQVDSGDPHQRNVEILGLTQADADHARMSNPRELAKRTLYAFLYGAGDGKLGRTVGRPGKGKEIREKLLVGVKGLKQLTRRCARGHEEKGELVGLDGRRIPTRSEHSALNSQLQADGAIVMKQAVVNMDRHAKAHALDWQQVLMVHDEVQAETTTSPVQAEHMMEQAIVLAGTQFNLRVPLRAEAKTGPNWAETH